MAVSSFSIHEVGKVIELREGIAKVRGLPSCMNGQMLEFNKETTGIVMGFDRGEALVFLFGDSTSVAIGSQASSTLKEASIPVGEAFLGRVTNALGKPIDDLGFLFPDSENPLFRNAPGVLDRKPIDVQLQTGITVLDANIPLGKGQRELIIGDRMTGKTAVAIDTIINQRHSGIKCIYCCIGKSVTSLQRVIETLRINNALENTIIMAATASDTMGEQYIAPYAAVAMGEYFMDKGDDVLVVFDDFTKHAWAYRELSLLMNRPPGREAYPGDVFYLHSQIMERAACLSDDLGAGTMSFLPIVDTIQGDISGFIPSNLVSMTDGQIFLNAGLFAQGQRPAVDLGLSVSRIGNKVQSSVLKRLSSMLRLEFLQFKELQKVSRFKAGLNPEQEKRMKNGLIMEGLFRQDLNKLYSPLEIILFLYAYRRGLLLALSSEEVAYAKDELYNYAKTKEAELVHRLQESSDWDKTITDLVDNLLVRFFKQADPQVIWGKNK